MNYVTQPTQPGELRGKAEAFKSLFEGSLVDGPPADLFDAWEICGAVRRGKPSVDVSHVVRPVMYTPDRDTKSSSAAAAAGLNPVWARLAYLAERGDVAPGRYWVEPESRVVECVHLGRLHRLFLATTANWGMQLVRHTGPDGYFEMTAARLKHAGVLTLHNGHVCHVDRSGAQLRMTVVECPTEDDYLRAARTRYLPPGRRLAGSPSTWTVGMQKPWVPEFLKPYVDPSRDPWLLSPMGNAKPVRRRPAAGRHNNLPPLPNHDPLTHPRVDGPGSRPPLPGQGAALPGAERPDPAGGAGAARA